MQWMTRCNQYLILELQFLFVSNLSLHFPSSKLFILHIFAKYHHNPCLIAGHITFLKTFHKNITIQNTSKRGREEFEKNIQVNKTPVPDLTIENFSHDAMITDVIIQHNESKMKQPNNFLKKNIKKCYESFFKNRNKRYSTRFREMSILLVDRTIHKYKFF